MNFLEKLIQKWYYAQRGIPTEPAEYRRALKNYILKNGLEKGMSVTVLGSMGLDMEVGPLRIRINGELPPICVETTVLPKSLAGLKEEYRELITDSGFSYWVYETLLHPDFLGRGIIENAKRWDKLVALEVLFRK